MSDGKESRLKVWIIEEDIGYQDIQILSVHASEESAKSRLASIVVEDSNLDVVYLRQNYVVGRDGMSANGRNSYIEINEYDVSE